MSGFLAASGAGAARHLRVTGGASWRRLDAPLAAFAWQPGIGLDNGGLFESPAGDCSGVLAGVLFGLEKLLAGYPAELDHRQRLGLFLHEQYRRYGRDLADRLDGCFALAMQVDGRLLLVRDAMGERPLYVLKHADGILAADRMAPLMTHPLCTRRLHPGATVDYLCTGFCPFERTPVQGIEKVLPGQLWVVESNTIRRHAWHRLGPPDDPPLDEAGAVELIRERLLAAAAKRRLDAEPAALLLSGGLDSSLAGALVGGERLRAAYSLSFGARYRNELPFSALMARHLGIPQRVVTVSPADIIEHFAATLATLDEPIGDPLTVPNLLVARQAARDARVIFNGEGGDPLFGGPKNLPMLAAAAFGSGNLPALYLMSYNKGAQYLETLLSPYFLAQRDGYPSTEALFSSLFSSAEPSQNEFSDESPLPHRLMLINTRLKGAAQILPKVFKIASAAGLIVRSPLFDRHLAEAAFRLPPGLKLRGSVEKYVLKTAAQGWVPEAIIERPKSGMLVPVQYWFRKDLRGFARRALLDRKARTALLFRREALRDLLDFKGGGLRGYHGDRIWLLLSLEIWMQAHGIESAR